MLLQMALFHSFLWLSSISLCVCVCVCVHVYCIFFIHSSVYRHLGCFRILAVVDNAALNIGVHVCFQISAFFSSEKYPEVGFLDHVVVQFLIF